MVQFTTDPVLVGWEAIACSIICGITKALGAINLEKIKMITSNTISKRLKSLKDEVKDFHPHLRALFERMHSPAQVDYTHGSVEFGADFILTILDESEGMSLVGIVAKLDSITQADLPAIKRQADECFKVSRPINNGQHKCRLNKVWVVITGTFTKNAQTVMSSEPTEWRGVTIIDVDRLAGLMNKYNYNPDDDVSSQVSVCLKKQISLANSLSTESIGNRIFSAGHSIINQQVIKREKRQYTQGGKRQKTSKIKQMSIENALNETNSLIIHGDPGAGKSKMLERVLRHYASSAQYNKTKSLPIFTTCKDMIDNHDGKILNLISEFKKKHQLEQEDDPPSYTLIIDGVDECDLPRDERVKHIQNWRRSAFQTNNKVHQIIFASRDDYLGDNIAGFSVFEIAPLQKKDVISTLKDNLRNIDNVSKIVDDVAHSDMLDPLIKNPLTVIILISVLNDSKGPQELPANLTDLFDKYAECSLGRWDNDSLGGYQQKRFQAAQSVLSNISEYMVKNNSYSLHQETVMKFFREYLEPRHLDISPDDLFTYVTTRLNLINMNDGIFKFRHRTVAEFFCAQKLHSTFIDELGDVIFETQWINVLFFYVGLQKDCSDLLLKIGAIKPKNENAKMMKIINMSNILFAGYASHYSGIAKVLMDIFIDTSKYLDNMLSDGVDSSIWHKSHTMHILFQFRLMMDQQYARPFFADAIVDSLIKVEDLDIPHNVKITSLFLLSMPYRTLGGGNVFKSMIEKMNKQSIPMHIQLAINHETDYFKDDALETKKFKRAMKRRLENSDFHKSIAPLYRDKLSDIARTRKKNKI